MSARRAAVAVLAVAVTWPLAHRETPATAAPAPPAVSPPAPAATPDIDAVRATLASFGYTVNTEARLDRAIRHFQRSSGLVVDGVVGPITMASLQSATATRPAVRIPTVATGEPPVPGVCSDYAATATEAGWPAALVPKVLRTMDRESHCQPTARSRTSDTGLMQINDIVLRDHRFRRDWPGVTQAMLYDPLLNLRVAWWLYTIDGWGPWRGGA